MIEELKPKFLKQKSFYKKAYVETWIDRDETSMFHHAILASYGEETAMAKVKNGYIKVLLCPNWQKSRTTIKHVREFLQQLGFTRMSKKEIIKQSQVVKRNENYIFFEKKIENYNEELKI